MFSTIAGACPRAWRLAPLLAFALAAPAQAAAIGDGSVRPNYQFPDGEYGFQLATHGGFVNPGVLVGFNPQPDPPGDTNVWLDLRKPYAPTIDNPALGQGFTFRFVIQNMGDGSVDLPPVPDSDGITRFSQVIDGHQLDGMFRFGPGPVDPGSWVGFNPQPEPPGDFVGGAFQFQRVGDPLMTFSLTLDGQPLSFAPVPEPSTWALLILGSGLIGAGLRRRAPVLA